MSTEEINIKKFFQTERDQQEYIGRVHKLLKKLTKLYKEFDPELHGNMVMQLARSEIQVYKYEMQVANDEESKIILQLLANERTHLRALYGQLMTSLKEIRGDKSTIKVEVPTDFAQYLVLELGKNIEDEDERAGKDSKDTDKSSSSGPD